MVFLGRVLTLLTATLGLLLALAVTGWAPPAEADGDAWRWPLDGSPAVVRDFSPPPTRFAAGHRGVDLAGAEGEPVLAAGTGVVAFAGLLAGRGVVSVVHAGGRRTTYEPVLPVVQQGQQVRAGDRLGTLQAGHPGCPAAACLHWGLRLGNDHYLDPRSLLGGGQVRLLPWWPAAWPAALPATRPGITQGGAQGSAPGSARAAGTPASPPGDAGVDRLALTGGAAALGVASLSATLGLARRKRRRPR